VHRRCSTQFQVHYWTLVIVFVLNTQTRVSTVAHRTSHRRPPPNLLIIILKYTYRPHYIMLMSSVRLVRVPVYRTDCTCSSSRVSPEILVVLPLQPSLGVAFFYRFRFIRLRAEWEINVIAIGT